jgi:AcrR family transcriptional regulator
MALTGRTKEAVVSEFRCAEILGAARRVFAKRGFNQATVDEIAEIAGVAKGTVYLYFHSKRDIYLGALADGAAELQQLTQVNMQAAEGMRAKIRAFIATRVEYAEQNRDFFKIYLAEFGNLIHPASINKEWRAVYLDQAKALEAILREAQKSGEIRGIRADAAAFTIYDMVRGVIAQRLLGWSKAGIEEDIDFLCNLVWTGIGAL